IGEVPITRSTARQFGVDLEPGRDDEPAMLTRAEALTVAAALGCRIPGEAEWESCCRAGSASLFVWGDTLPMDTDLESWMAWDMADPDLRCNEFGFGGLFFGEWCDDEFRSSHDSNALVEHGAFVVKGGGAQFWPWQDDEWVWCLPAMRMPSTALFTDGRCAARLA